ncbi:hemoglobin subunit mu isoform X3 [Antechinus flavipes]|uniref:hemoglobin subunit mu isoform X3 n=1 Tax=Antechinus flavipes TaxID=38775 RepID=UPI002235DC43|nr:hemoglobin subunit mu isoform X3 [Antechinus flavipes]
MFSAEERSHIVQIWNYLSGHEAIFGTELLQRLFTVYPSTKSYFPPLIPGLELTQMQNHGEQILMAVGVAVDNMYDLRTALSGLADLHAYSLRVEPTNFHVSLGALLSIHSFFFPIFSLLTQTLS